MSLSSISCPSCGAREVARVEGRWTCTFCKATFTPRMLPGSLCDDGETPCGRPAETPCRVCARPLCTRHNDPKAFYWHEPLHWRRRVHGWTAADGAEWERLLAPIQRFPLPDFQPFPMTPHEREALYAIGRLEDELHHELRGLARAAGGDTDETAARFESLCLVCERETFARLAAAVERVASRHSELAFPRRLEALRADLEQDIRYVEAFVGRRLSARAVPEGRLQLLGADSPRLEWERVGQELRRRLTTLDRLKAGLGLAGRERADASPKRAE